MTGRRWRTVAICLTFLTVFRGVPWFIDTLGTTWGIVFGLILGSLVLIGAVCTPLKPDPPAETAQEKP